ncbi:helix-turn-helix domain-containing protein [Gordonia sp. NPDC003376]
MSDRQDDHSTSAFDRALADVLRQIPDETKKAFVRSIDAAANDTLDPDLWGPTPTCEDHKTATLEILRREYSARRAVIGESISTNTAATLLNVSLPAVLDRIANHDLVAIKNGRAWQLPTWQFRPDTVRGHVDGLAQLFDVFPGNVITLTAWVTRPNVDLEDACPVDLLAAGDIDTVINAARALTPVAW